MFRWHVSVTTVVLLCTAILAGCGGHNTAAPTAPNAAAPPAAQPSTSGATIMGTIVGVSTTSSIRPQRTSITVNVTGTTVTASVDDNGRFTLNNVPAGRVDLHFLGNGIDAHLVLDGVSERATLVITIRVSGNDARLEDDRRNNGQSAEIEGTIAAGSLSGSCAAHTLSFMVGSTRVVTNASTLFRDGTCESLKGGSRVEVKGTRQNDNSILAMTIEGEDDDDNEDKAEAEVKGVIAAGSLAGSCAANSLSFKVGSTTVKTNAATRFNDTMCTSLKAGDSVEVKGTRQGDGSVLASRVERKK